LKNPDVVPLLLYNDDSGEWERKGDAALLPDGSAYYARVDHLSAYNVDIFKTDPACMRIDSAAISGPYSLDIIVPSSSGDPTYRNQQINNAPGDQQHAILNLPPNEQIGLIPMRVTPNPSCPGEPDVEPIGIFVGNTGNAIPGGRLLVSDFNPPYAQCGPDWATLTDINSTAQIVVDGSNDGLGRWAAAFFALFDQTGPELYPLGSTSCNFYTNLADESCSLFSIVDTGSSRLVIGEDQPNRLTGTYFSQADADLLGVPHNTTVSVRLNGVARRDASGVPEDAVGTARGAEVQVDGAIARLGSQSSGGARDLTLIGTDVLRNIVTVIDNTVQPLNVPEITDPYGYSDVSFFPPGDPGIPTPQVTLHFDVFAPGAQPPRYAISNVRWQEGCPVADDTPDTIIEPLQFFYDTGAAFTLIGDRLASALELQIPGDYDCFAINDGKGFFIDKLTMTGVGGSYTVTDAMGCWDQSRIRTVLNTLPADAVIGSNLFRQVKLVIDGPNAELGVILP
jgi:hypothetical protein